MFCISGFEIQIGEIYTNSGAAKVSRRRPKAARDNRSVISRRHCLTCELSRFGQKSAKCENGPPFAATVEVWPSLIAELQLAPKQEMIEIYEYLISEHCEIRIQMISSLMVVAVSTFN